MRARVTECEVDRVDDCAVLALGDEAVELGHATGGSLSGRGGLAGRRFGRLG